MGIGSLVQNVPTSGQPASTGQTEIVSIKAAIASSFPAFTPGVDVCTLTGPQLNQLQVDMGTKQTIDTTLTALAGLNAATGLVEQTGVDVFAKRLLGVAAGTSVPTRDDADGRYGRLAAVNTWTLQNNFTALDATGIDVQNFFASATADVPTVATGTNDTNAASTAFVRNAITAYANANSYAGMYTGPTPIFVGDVGAGAGTGTFSPYGTQLPKSADVTVNLLSGSLTVSLAGDYEISVTGIYYLNASPGTHNLHVAKNGTEIVGARYRIVETLSSVTNQLAFSISTIATLAASDALILRASYPAGGGLLVFGVHFTIKKVS